MPYKDITLICQLLYYLGHIQVLPGGAPVYRQARREGGLEESMGDRQLETPKGKIYLRARATPEFIAGLELDPGMGVFSGPNYPAAREQKALIRLAGSPGSNVTITYSEEGSILGFVAIAPPSETERWSNLKDQGLIEAMAIEVSSGWRSLGIAEMMLEELMNDPYFDDKIVMCTGYSWHWDLEGLGVSKAKYRTMLLKYLEKAGFVYYDTDEPNIALDPANFFAARIGSSVSRELYAAFDRLLFRESAWAEMRGRPRSIREELERWSRRNP
jgi:acetoin utilization protein AcuA